MAASAKPSTRGNVLTRKAGPLPVYAYLLLAAAAWFLFLRGGSSTANASTPVGPASGALSAQQPASGQGTPADNANADLLSALGVNGDSLDALLQAVQATSAYGASGGGYGTAGSSGGSSGSPGGAGSATVVAPVVEDSNGAPPNSSDQGAAAAPFVTYPVVYPTADTTLSTFDVGQTEPIPSKPYEGAPLADAAMFTRPVTTVDPRPIVPVGVTVAA